jgi:signal transduction histidine kinase
MSFFSGLRGRLLFLAAGFVLLGVLLIYPMLASLYRDNWLQQRAQAAQIASLAVAAAPTGEVSEDLSRELLAQAQVVSVAALSEDSREMILAPAVKIDGPLVPIDLRTNQGWGAVPATFAHLFAPPGRFLQIKLTPLMTHDKEMEVIVPEAPLRAGLIGFSRTLLLSGLAISAIVGALIYFAIYGLVVRPMQGLTDSVIRFSEHPDATEISFTPGGSEEMQRASQALAAMQRAVSAAFRQRKRLAELGEAVAKINHDLRNSLAAAQIVSESLAQSEDPRVKKALPRLERAIQRAVSLAQSTLNYSRAQPTAPDIHEVEVIPVIEEAAAEGLAGAPEIEWVLQGPQKLSALADPEHIHRIIANLVRNAVRAIAEQTRTTPGRVTVSVSKDGDNAVIQVADNGPGIPAKVKDRLFQPFQASGSSGGAGLGLAIARELARGMKGELELSSTCPEGSAFTLRIPAAA